MFTLLLHQGFVSIIVIIKLQLASIKVSWDSGGCVFECLSFKMCCGFYEIKQRTMGH